MADDAIARWADSSLPKLPGKPSVKLCSPNPTCNVLPNVSGKSLGQAQSGMYVFLFDAQAIKLGIAYLKNEF